MWNISIFLDIFQFIEFLSFNVLFWIAFVSSSRAFAQLRDLHVCKAHDKNEQEQQSMSTSYDSGSSTISPRNRIYCCSNRWIIIK